MANKENKFTKAHKSLRVEVFNKTQRKNRSISRNAKLAAKRLYKEIRPTIVMHLVKGNSLFFKLDESLELFIYIANDGNPFYPSDSAAPTIKLSCFGRKKRGKLINKDRKMFDQIYITELAGYLNVEALDTQEYHEMKS